MFAGIAGGLFAHFTAFLSPNTFQFTTSFYLIIMIVVGGMGSIEGAILGAILITVILEAFREFGAFRFVNFAVLLVLIMLYRPQGIVGSWSFFRKSGAR
jgi:branched-chain amino acid transport system permease protein